MKRILTDGDMGMSLEEQKNYYAHKFVVEVKKETKKNGKRVWTTEFSMRWNQSTQN